MYALDEKTILLTGFYFDGNAPATYFRSIIGTSRFSTENEIIPDEDGSYEALGIYVDETISLTLPDNYIVQNIGFIAVWCYTFDINFGEVDLNGVSRDLVPSSSILVYPPLPHPDDLCTPVPSENISEVNCKQLDDNITVSWVINREQEDIVIELCGCTLCVQTDSYIAFGVSGSDSGVQMISSDVVWTWLNNEGVHADELNINAYSQCQVHDSGGNITQTGVCPDIQNDVHSVSGYRDGCKTCITYTRSLISNDSSDKSFRLDQYQWVIWSVGPVGSLQTSTNRVIPVPFKHYLRADFNRPLQVNFSRTPLNECQQLQCSASDIQLPPWRQPGLDIGDTFTVYARIGQSGGQRGYAGITGVSGWGISWYLNGLLIPSIKLYRGFKYTFIVEGGDDPHIPARYHPFYITNSERGGFLVKSEEERTKEVVYAGFDADGNPLGVGRYCEYRNQLKDRSNEYDTFDAYKDTLTLFCLNGTSGQFTWIPDHNTPDIVYYQCASHQFLGWKIDIIEPPPGDYQTDTNYLITLSELEPDTYCIRIIAEDAKGETRDRSVFRRTFTIPEYPLDCSPYLINNGIISNNDEVTFTFSSTGLHESFTCQLDNEPSVPCDSPYVLHNLTYGEHRLRITPTECEGNTTTKSFKFQVQDNGNVVQQIEEVCPPVSVVDISTQQPIITKTTSTLGDKFTKDKNGSTPTRTSSYLVLNTAILVSLLILS